jgi:hypothetical protein
MAVTLLSGSTPRYIGTVTERTNMDPLPAVGAEFFESDTGLTYVFCGGTTWTLKLYPEEAPI